MQLRRFELRLCRVINSYTLPDDLAPADSKKVFEEFGEPEELIQYPKTLVKIDTEDTLLFAVLTSDLENAEGNITKQQFDNFVSKTIESRYEIDDVAKMMATLDMEETYEEELRLVPKFRNSEAFIKRVFERTSILKIRMKEAIETLTNKKS